MFNQYPCEGSDQSVSADSQGTVGKTDSSGFPVNPAESCPRGESRPQATSYKLQAQDSHRSRLTIIAGSTPAHQPIGRLLCDPFLRDTVHRQHKTRCFEHRAHSSRSAWRNTEHRLKQRSQSSFSNWIQLPLLYKHEDIVYFIFYVYTCISADYTGRGPWVAMISSYSHTGMTLWM